MTRLTFLTCLAFGFVGASRIEAQTGHVLQGAGPVNESMAGTGTATRLDSMGSLYWNPASIRGLERSELTFGLQVFTSDARLDSSVAAGAFGPGVPAADQSGSSSSDTGPAPIPTMGLVYRTEGSPFTFGLGAFGVAGFGVDYAASTSNPITTPQPPDGFGFGGIYSDYQLLQVTPTLAWQATERLSFGFAPVVNWAKLAVAPFAGAAPDDADGDGFPSYASGTHASTAWGLGLHLGVFWEGPSGWNLGLGLKSPQVFENFKINSTNELGAPRSLVFDLDFPGIVSVGIAYEGFERWVLATDLRWIDYEHTDGFDKSGFAADGSMRGFGWDSIGVLSLGAQYMVSPEFSVRGGYLVNGSPIDGDSTFYNVASPAIVEHHAALGMTWNPTEDASFSLAWQHGFENSTSGQFVAPTGGINGTEVESSLSTNSLSFGISVRF